VTFSASASTYQNGRYFNFTLRPGGHQAYYATYDSFNNPPFFNVSFDPIHQSNSIQISDINTVFERNNWYPQVGDEGRPHAIAIDVSGYYLTPSRSRPMPAIRVLPRSAWPGWPCESAR